MKPGRNDPCPCGSGKKYKKCCADSQSFTSPFAANDWRTLRATEGHLIETLITPVMKFYGKEGTKHALNEFFTWLDETHVRQDVAGLEQTFLPWLLFNWVPDQAEPELNEFPKMPFGAGVLQAGKDLVSPYEARIIETNLITFYSIYQIEQIEPDKSMTLLDLLCGTRITIQEKAATRSLEVGQLIMARVLSMDGHSIASGMYPVPLPARYRLDVEAFRRQHRRTRHFNTADLFDFSIDIRRLFIETVEMLRRSPKPRMVNTDGDSLVINEVYFELKCSPQEAFDALCDLALIVERDELLEEANFNAKKEMKSIEFRWCRTGHATNPELDNTVLGDIYISPGELMIKVNSNERATLAKKIVKQRLSQSAVYRNIKQESAEAYIKKLENQPLAEPEDDINDRPEVQNAESAACKALGTLAG